jgi:hypothetical protein
MKIINKSINKAYDLWRHQERRFHFSAAFHKNKMIEWATNDTHNMSTKAYRLGQKFNINKYKRYPYLHSESHLVYNLMSKFNWIDPTLSVVVLRINPHGKILLSKPCNNCAKILNAVGLTKVFWSIDCNTFGGPDNRLIDLREIV